MSMQQLSLREVQLEELELLKDFDQFCKKHNLKYSLCYGTLIGAARHKGFIPWDDDIDVCMPRPDYERLLTLKASYDHDGLELIANPINHSLDSTYAAIVNRNIPCENTYSNTLRSKYLWIDIFPVDGFCEDMSGMEEIYKKSIFYQKILTLASAKLFKGKTLIHKLGKLLIVPLCRLFGKQRCIDRMDRLAKSYTYEDAEYVGVIAWGEGVKERLRKDDFEIMDEIEFEDEKFSVMSCWEVYLDNMYENYMELPPLEQRRGHNIVAYKIGRKE